MGQARIPLSRQKQGEAGTLPCHHLNLAKLEQQLEYRGKLNNCQMNRRSNGSVKTLVLTPHFQMRSRELKGLIQNLPKLVAELEKEPSLLVQAL